MVPLPLILAAALPAADPHSLANPQLVRPTHVALDLTVRFEDKTIRGRADLSVEYPQGEAKAATQDLDTRELTIESVTDAAGKPQTRPSTASCRRSSGCFAWASGSQGRASA
jgi:aminopeptidase N